jgi:hypothetical protein
VDDDAPAVTSHPDDRGGLVAVELPRVDFEVRRVFAVSGSDGRTDRGNHVIPCEQLMVLVHGSVAIQVGPDADHLAPTVVLDTPGGSLRLPAGEYVRYRLSDPSSVVMVLAEHVYRRPSPA